MLIKRKWLAASIVAALGAAGATVMQMTPSSGSLPMSGLAGTLGLGSVPPAPPSGTGDNSSLVSQTQSYIIVLAEAPVASYKGEVSGLAAPARMRNAQGVSRVDVKSTTAQRYVRYLRDVQAGRVADIGRQLGRPLRVKRAMQHAINAIVADLTPAEARRLRSTMGVAMVEAYQEFPIASDVGPRLIGAEPVWNGTTPATSSRFQGEGIVVGIIDTGINWASPSFAAVDPIDGYRHVNELGAGNYLGTCAPGGPDEGRCNDKLIGGYDFVCDVPVGSGTYCNQPTLYREEPGFTDSNNHGSHVAGTAAGNRRDVQFKGTTLRIAGVAPRANIVAYDVCFTNLSTGGGSCPNVSTVAAINQAVADGVVDVINYSIGGGTSPWSDAVSQAFLNAADAGIYVAAAAGNSGPGPNTLGHHQPWVGTTAAAQHGRGDFVFRMDVTSPTPVPNTLQRIALVEGSGGPSLSATLPAGTPLRVSPRIDTTDDGCAAFPADTFAGSIAMVRRGTCSFAIKVNNASAAGATAVVIANNQAGTLAPSVPGTTVPSFLVTQVTANEIRDFAGSNGGAITATIPMGAEPVANTADQLAAFSSRGPAASWGVMKPDITAPGVSILAAYAATATPGSENIVGLMNGTSMASPHHAGAAALVRQARPTWTAAEVKSAIMMTAKPEVLLEDGVTAANVFARGSGRVQVDRAIQAGLVLNETKDRYLAANPATGGSPASLNMPNLIDAACFERCTFTRTFRNTLSHRQAWAVKAEGLSVSISPALFAVNPGATVRVTFTVNAQTLPANSQFNYGTIVLQPQSAGNPNQPTLRMPMAIAVRPAIASAPPQVTASVPAGGTGSATFALGNTGGSRLNFTVDNTGNGTATVASAPVDATLFTGYLSNRYTSGTTTGQFAADDFEVHASTRMTSLVAEGFVRSGGQPLSTATGITWSIFSNAGGVPGGSPMTNGSAVWTYTTTPSAAGVGIAGGTISLNLPAAAQNVVLPPGRYWLVVNAVTAPANGWVWYLSDRASINSLNGLANLQTPTPGTWAANTAYPGLAWQADGQVACGASWITGATPSTGQLVPGASSNIMVSINAAGMSAGNYTGYACVATSDPARPKVAVRVALTVTP